MADNEAARGINILVVDDEDIVLHLVEDTLTDEGYQVTTTASAHQAIEMASAGGYDFILTDIRMPEMNGIEMVREIHKTNPAIGVIFMTGYANLDTAKQAIKEGAYDYIMKPFELTEIRQALTRAVQQKRSTAEAALTTELNKIADLSNLIYASGDLSSLLRLSLSSAILQSGAQAGIAVFYDRRQEKLMGMRAGKQANVIEDEWVQNVPSSEWDGVPQFRAPYQLQTENHFPLTGTPFFAAHRTRYLPEHLFRPSLAVIMPLLRAERLLGLILLFHGGPTYELKTTDIQQLSFISSQLAISLENVQLLEESREAYQRLEYLQEQTIQMERLATRGQMSAEIGHELNNYLGVVTANFQLMKLRLQKGVTDGLDKYVQSIEDHLDKTSRFTKGLMDYSSLQNTKFERIDVNRMLRQIVEFLQPQKRFREFALEFQPDGETLEADIDQGLLEQVLYNFLNNAADASKDSQLKKIVVSTRSLPDMMLRIAVKDHGQGIEAGNIDKLFKEKFTTKESGHGIGLVVCKNIIDRHQGRISVDSVLGQGTQFMIDLPVNHEITEKSERAASRV